MKEGLGRLQSRLECLIAGRIGAHIAVEFMVCQGEAAVLDRFGQPGDVVIRQGFTIASGARVADDDQNPQTCIGSCEDDFHE